MNRTEYNQSVENHSDAIYRFVLKHTRDSDLAHDLVQDTYEKLWIKKDGVDSGKVKSYLFTTAYHKIVDHSRRQKFKGDFNEVIHQPTTNNHYSDTQEILENLVNLLPADQKAVIMLRDYEGYSYQEIAKITQLTESQVKVYIFRARKFLKEKIGKMEILI